MPLRVALYEEVNRADPCADISHGNARITTDPTLYSRELRYSQGEIARDDTVRWSPERRCCSHAPDPDRRRCSHAPDQRA